MAARSARASARPPEQTGFNGCRVDSAWRVEIATAAPSKPFCPRRCPCRDEVSLFQFTDMKMGTPTLRNWIDRKIRRCQSESPAKQP